MAETVVGRAGRYDDQAIRVFKETKAEAVVLFVLGGSKGHGLSCSALPANAERVSAMIPDLLREIADAIEGQGHPDGIRYTTKD